MLLFECKTPQNESKKGQKASFLWFFNPNLQVDMGTSVGGEQRGYTGLVFDRSLSHRH